MIAKDVLRRRHRSAGIERVPLVRYGEVEHSPWAEYPDHVPEGPKRVLAVLKEMVCDHEVLGAVADRGQALAVVQDVYLDERCTRQLGVVPSKLVDRQMVDVTHVRRARDVQRVVEGADLDALASEVATRDLAPSPAWRIDGSAQPADEARDADHPEENRRSSAAGTGLSVSHQNVLFDPSK